MMVEPTMVPIVAVAVGSIIVTAIFYSIIAAGKRIRMNLPRLEAPTPPPSKRCGTCVFFNSKKLQCDYDDGTYRITSTQADWGSNCDFHQPIDDGIVISLGAAEWIYQDMAKNAHAYKSTVGAQHRRELKLAIERKKNE